MGNGGCLELQLATGSEIPSVPEQGGRVCMNECVQPENQPTLAYQWPFYYELQTKTQPYCCRKATVILHLTVIVSVFHNMQGKYGIEGNPFYMQLMGSVKVDPEILPQEVSCS